MDARERSRTGSGTGRLDHVNQISAGMKMIGQQSLVIGSSDTCLPGRGISGSRQFEREQGLDGFPEKEFDEVGNEQTAFCRRDGTGLGQFGTRRTLQLVKRAIIYFQAGK
jgi:hypothetical protein